MGLSRHIHGVISSGKLGSPYLYSYLNFPLLKGSLEVPFVFSFQHWSDLWQFKYPTSSITKSRDLSHQLVCYNLNETWNLISFVTSHFLIFLLIYFSVRCWFVDSFKKCCQSFYNRGQDQLYLFNTLSVCIELTTVTFLNLFIFKNMTCSCHNQYLVYFTVKPLSKIKLPSEVT